MVLWAVAWASLTNGGWAQLSGESPKLTSQVFAELYAEHLALELQQQPLPKNLLFKPAPLSTFQGFLDAALQTKLLALGFSLYERDSLEQAMEFATLECYATQAEFFYEWLTDNKAKRCFKLMAVCKVLSRDGQTLLVKNLTLARQDTVQATHLQRLEDKRFPETVKTPVPSLWESAATPMLVVSAIGIIVFLFFSVRSR
ncbi:MAG: hypothetical protein RML35_08810 [Chloroherpetonaceae bacterium]|nr:hypothetical protein [Chloroherpetonaceae bacterium]